MLDADKQEGDKQIFARVPTPGEGSKVLCVPVSHPYWGPGTFAAI
jgi:hypothetical protein